MSWRARAGAPWATQERPGRRYWQRSDGTWSPWYTWPYDPSLASDWDNVAGGSAAGVPALVVVLVLVVAIAALAAL